MTRLIDTMGYDELSKFIDYVASIPSSFLNELEVRRELETLFAPAPHWSDNLDGCDSSTWVFCFVSDDSPEDTRHPLWVRQLSKGGYMGHGQDWKYATPVDLNVRYTEGGGDD